MKMHFIMLISLLFLASCKGETEKNTVQSKQTEPTSFQFIALNKANSASEAEQFLLKLHHKAKQVIIAKMQGTYRKISPASYSEYDVPSEALCAAILSGSFNSVLFAIEKKELCKLFYRQITTKNDTTDYPLWHEVDINLLGRWENENQPEFWVIFDAFKKYSDAYEYGIEYRISGDTIYSEGNPIMHISQLSPTSYLENAPDESYRRTWVKADFE